MSEPGGQTEDIAGRVRTEIDRAILRNIKGLMIISFPKPYIVVC